MHKGGGTAETAALQPIERLSEYPEPARFGSLPARHFFLSHVGNVEFSHVELQSAGPDARPAFWLDDVNGADFSYLKLPRAAPAFLLNDRVTAFRVSASREIKDAAIDAGAAGTRI